MTNRQKFTTYRRGQLIIVDFRNTEGNELRGKHPAIVLTKKDSPYNGVLTVIPLSSKNKPYYLPLGPVLAEPVVQALADRLAELRQESERCMVTKPLDLASAVLLIEQVKAIDVVVKVYLNMQVASYAMPGSVTTISKKKIARRLNYEDPLSSIRVSSDIMDAVDAAIAETILGRCQQKLTK